MKIAVVGLGLIGGSMAMVLKHRGFASKVIGVDNQQTHTQKALELGIVDEVADLDSAIASSDLVILSAPVSVCEKLLPHILDLVTHQVVLDTGSTKTSLLEAVKGHANRGRYIATHPMWGTEFSGPEAATLDAFDGRANVICDAGESDKDALETVERLYKLLGMYNVYMGGKDHDVHVAYVSHISHITSFALANTVLEKEKEENAIFELASAGFESTVRLAKSSPAMWMPIFKQNKENVLDVLNEHITQLRKFKSCIEKENWAYLTELMEHANKIKDVLDRKQ
ncbi:prephenate dehydrogenase [Pedobacter panaciterrae]|jgi:Prephenate dehydrogenase|uniref:Prephenate dehydrogenase n=1 Tax=Pedobacter panaciterrae TaxID=363849 RepID=A0ABU8NI91_9SPHI|nr:prephenate dehydrogenase [Pedobacter panaciterrae]NQX53973.1 prephenate dehydrogenase [Pedobacter panaciterrae]